MADPDHTGWTHQEEMAWDAQSHSQELAKVEATKELDTLKATQQFELNRLEAGGDQRRKSRRQWVRFLIIVLVVAIWLTQTAYITYYSIRNADVLADIEKFVLLIGVTGAVVYMLVPKLWPEQAESEEAQK